MQPVGYLGPVYRSAKAAMNRARARGCAGVILVYHSVAALDWDPFGIAVSPEQFDAHMEILSRRFAPQSLGQLCAGLHRAELPQRPVVVTFDDGYANNLSAAQPSLAAHQIPATLFLATGYVGEQREFWWDELERLVRGGCGAGGDPTLELRVSGASLRCSMRDESVATHLLWRWLHQRPAGEIEAGLQQVRRWAGVQAAPAPRESHRPMTLDEVRELDRSGVEIAAHTRTHPRLGAQEETVQRDEIGGSRADLEAWLGKRTVSFAYPYGNPATDYTRTSVELVRELGFERAVSTSAELARPSSSRYALPRYFVTTRAPAEFERWLAARFRSLPARASEKLVGHARQRLGR